MPKWMSERDPAVRPHPISRITVTFPPAISQKKIHGSICPLKRVRDRKEWRFRDRRCRSLGGLRRRHAPPPEAGALHGARHGASGAVPPVGRTASFIMTLPPWIEVQISSAGGSTWQPQALRDRPAPQRPARMVLLRPGTTCPQSVRARSCGHLEAYPTF